MVISDARNGPFPSFSRAGNCTFLAISTADVSYSFWLFLGTETNKAQPHVNTDDLPVIKDVKENLKSKEFKVIAFIYLASFEVLTAITSISVLEILRRILNTSARLDR